MSDVIVTWPKTRTLRDYLDELERASQQGAMILYLMSQRPNVLKGERCYMLHDGAIRGWLRVVDLTTDAEAIDVKTGEPMRRSRFQLWRHPRWHPIPPVEMAGFRGFRYAERVIHPASHQGESE